MAAPTQLTIQQLNSITGEDVVWVGADLVNGNQFQNTGRAALLVKTTGSITISIPSRPDAAGRLGDVLQPVSGLTDPFVHAFGPYVDPSIWGDGVQLQVFYSGFAGHVTPKIAAVQI